MPGILVVEDDENLNRGITFSLKKSGYEVFSAESVKKAKRIASDNHVDVTICDVNLPDGNGLELVRWMRNCQNVYIICLTALDQETDQVMGYEAGADDYMTKPFEIRELLMRIQAISRRSHHQDTSHPVVGNLSYDPATCEICNTQTKKSVQVSGKEMQLLEFFMNNCNQVLEKNQITTKIWGFDSNAEYNNVEVYVSFLRRKFHHLQVNVTLRAIRGVGYIMEVSDD